MITRIQQKKKCLRFFSEFSRESTLRLDFFFFEFHKNFFFFWAWHCQFIFERGKARTKQKKRTQKLFSMFDEFMCHFFFETKEREVIKRTIKYAMRFAIYDLLQPKLTSSTNWLVLWLLPTFPPPFISNDKKRNRRNFKCFSFSFDVSHLERQKIFLRWERTFWHQNIFR
jgi:hypothetical protein